jgi:hypothetical protein
MNTVKIGDISEAKVLARFLQLGYTVLIPWSNGERYDMVIERVGQFSRVQVKTGRFFGDRGAIRCPLFNVNGSSRQRMLYDGSQIDYFAIYCPDNDKIYLINIQKVKTTEIILRIAPPKNNRVGGINWAKDYEI